MVGESVRFVAVENKRKKLSEAVGKNKGGVIFRERICWIAESRILILFWEKKIFGEGGS
jgi:hypothetical protein